MRNTYDKPTPVTVLLAFLGDGGYNDQHDK